MIMKILSPSSVKLDRWIKYKLYEKAGVKEYWLIAPVNESVEIYLLSTDHYIFKGVFTKGDMITADSLPDLELNLEQIFV